MKIEKKYKSTLLTVLMVLPCSIRCLGEETESWESKMRENNLTKAALECVRKEEAELCLKWNAANFLRRLAGAEEPIAITDYMSLVRTTKTGENETSNEESSKSILLNPSESREEKNEKLDGIIWDNLVSIFNTRTIQIGLPPDTFEGTFSEEGRKKKNSFKKDGGMLMMAGMMGGMMMKMFMAGIAALAGKALLVAKVSLVLSLIVALHKLAGGGSKDGGTKVVYTSSEQVGGGWTTKYHKRNMHVNDDGSNLAYNAYEPSKLTRP